MINIPFVILVGLVCADIGIAINSTKKNTFGKTFLASTIVVSLIAWAISWGW